MGCRSSQPGTKGGPQGRGKTGEGKRNSIREKRPFPSGDFSGAKYRNTMKLSERKGNFRSQDTHPKNAITHPSPGVAIVFEKSFFYENKGGRGAETRFLAKEGKIPRKNAGWGFPLNSRTRKRRNLHLPLKFYRGPTEKNHETIQRLF